MEALADRPRVPSDACQFQPGAVLAGRFDVVRYISSGGMGEVYEVADRHLHGVRLALKTILRQAAGSSGMQDRFEREVLLARRVVHRNMCPIYDIFHVEHAGKPLLFLTMKLIPGETLEDRIKRVGKIGAEDARTIVEQVAGALGAAHQVGVLHRDVKTSNIMLEQSAGELCVYVMDFGLARSYQGESTALTVDGLAGTLGYLAPEVLHGAPPSIASDVYAFGVVVFRMLTGMMPGELLTGEEGERRETMKRLFSAEWRRLVEGCLEASVERRCKGMPQAIAALEGGGSLKAKSAEWLTGPAAISRRRLLAGGAAVMVSAATAGAWLERERIVFWMEPLPERRFVALMVWPSADLPAVLATVLDSIGNRLARAEKNFKDLLILTVGDLPQDGPAVRSPPDVVSALGANLVLAASLVARPDRITLKLQVLEAATQRVIRRVKVSRMPGDVSSLAQAACVAAARILGLPQQETALKDVDELQGVSAEVYRLYGEAERWMSDPNDAHLQDAILKYQQALEVDPKFALGYARLAMAYTDEFVLRDNASALQLAGENAALALKFNPRSAKGLLAQGVVLLFRAKTEAALDYFAKSLEADPGNPETRIGQATAYRSVGRVADAEKVYRAVLGDRPNNWVARNELGFLLAQQARYKEAATEFGAAIASAPQAALPVANLAAIYLTMGRNEDALQTARRSLSLGPTQAAYRTLGDLAFGDKRYQVALDYYNQGANLDPRTHVIWRDIGDCYAMLGQPDRVKKSYAKAGELLAADVARTPKAGPMWATLAFYRAKTGDATAARMAIRTAEADGGRDVESEFLIVQALAVLGEREEAMQRLLKCMEMGLSPVEVDDAVDLAELEKDPRYVARQAALLKSTRG